MSRRPIQNGRMDHIRRTRGVPAKRGMRVEVNGSKGQIASARGGSLYVRFDGGRCSVPCHPTWRVVYFDDDGNVLHDTRSS